MTQAQRVTAAIVGIGVAVAAGVGVVWFKKSNTQPSGGATPPVAQQEERITREGNLMSGNPGLAPGGWYLSYDTPGKPGNQAQLMFDEAICASRDLCSIPALAESFRVGDRVRVVGIEREGLFVVVGIEKITERIPVQANSAPSPAAWTQYAQSNPSFNLMFAYPEEFQRAYATVQVPGQTAPMSGVKLIPPTEAARIGAKSCGGQSGLDIVCTKDSVHGVVIGTLSAIIPKTTVTGFDEVRDVMVSGMQSFSFRIGAEGEGMTYVVVPAFANESLIVAIPWRATPPKDWPFTQAFIDRFLSGITIVKK